MAVLMQQATQARGTGDLAAARDILESIRIAEGDDFDEFVVQQIALTTYPLQQPSKKGLAGRKRLAGLYDRTPEQRAEDLDNAIDALQRAFHLKHNYYNSINLVHLLNVRSSISAGDDAIANRIAADRIPRRVILVRSNVLDKPIAGENETAKSTAKFWVGATLAEAYFGLGDEAAAEDQLARAEAIPPPEGWMAQSTQEQIGKLRALIST